VAYMKENESAPGKILIIGDVILEQNIIGRVGCSCSDSSVPVLNIKETMHYPGGAANIAALIKAMGAEVTLAGVIGKDEEGERLRRFLNQKNISSVLKVDGNRPTALMQRIGTEEELLIRLDKYHQDEIVNGIFHDILKVVTLLLEDVKQVVIVDYGKGLVTGSLLSTVCEVCQSKGIPVFMELQCKNLFKKSSIEMIKIPYSSLEALYGHRIQNTDDMEKAANLVFTALGCKTLIVSWSPPAPNGVLLFRRYNDWIHFPLPVWMKSISSCETEEIFMAALIIAVSRSIPMDLACKQASEAIINRFINNNHIRDISSKAFMQAFTSSSRLKSP
jgi:rfaE bifunctional protein kinase chain/domain